MNSYVRSLLAEFSSSWMKRRLERRGTMSVPAEPQPQTARPVAQPRPVAQRRPPVNEALHRASNM